MKHLIEQLTFLKTMVPEPTRKVFLFERIQREMSRSRISESQKYKPSISFFEFLRVCFQAARAPSFVTVTFLTGLCVIIIGSGVAFAVYLGDPGEALYEARVMLEEAPLVTFGGEARALKEVQLAQVRQREILAIIKSDDTSEHKAKKITNVVRHLSRNIEAVGKRVKKFGDAREKSGTFGAVARTVKSGVQDIRQTLGTAAKVVQDANNTTSVEFKKASLKIAQAELVTLSVLIDVAGGDDGEEQTTFSESVNEATLSKDVALLGEPVGEDGGDEEKPELADYQPMDRDTSVEAVKIADGDDKTKNASEKKNIAVGDENAELKENIKADLEQLIAQLETVVNKTGEKTFSLPQADGVGDATVLDPKIATTSDALGAKEVVLNVQEIIEAEMKGLERDRIRQEIIRLINEARQFLKEGNASGTVNALEEATKLQHEL